MTASAFASTASRSPQVATFDRIVEVDGPTQTLIRWFEDEGGQGLDFRWLPTEG